MKNRSTHDKVTYGPGNAMGPRPSRLVFAIALALALPMGLVATSPAHGSGTAMARSAVQTAVAPFVLSTELNLGDSARGSENGQPGDALGDSVALSADGHIALVGAPQRIVGDHVYAGAAEVFRLIGGSWSAPTELSLGANAGGSGHNGDNFGASVALSGDGSTALIAAPGRFVSGQGYSGALEVFTFSGGVWSTPTELHFGSAKSAPGYLFSVALSGDGDTALAGSDVFRFTDGAWSGPTRLGSVTAASSALSGDGNTAVLGAPDLQANTAKIFRFRDGAWSLQKTLMSGPKTGGTFGNSVALSSDGNTFFSSGYGRAGGTTGAYGEVFSYTDGGWGAPIELKPGPGAGEIGGSPASVALSSNGDMALVADPNHFFVNGHRNFPGQAEVYRLNGGSWSQLMGISLARPGSGDYFGASVALSGDGAAALVGVPGRAVNPHDGESGVVAGAAEVFVADPNAVAVTLNASRPHGVRPVLSGISPDDPRVTYTPAGDALEVTGLLRCGTSAGSTGSRPAGTYDIHSCGGLSDPGHTVVYDYVNSSYIVTLAPVTLKYTGPRTLKHGKKATLSARLTSAVTGLPIKGRTLRMQIGALPTPGGPVQTCTTGKTNGKGRTSCLIKNVKATISPNVVTMRFAGDRRGHTITVSRSYDFAAGREMAAITISP